MPKAQSEENKKALTQVEQVFATWQRFQANPDRCLLSSIRDTLLKARLKEYSVYELEAVILWAYKSSDQRAIYLRENGYGDLDNLFRKTKIDGRIEAARDWLDETEGGILEESQSAPIMPQVKVAQKPAPIPEPPPAKPAIRAVSMRRA